MKIAITGATGFIGQYIIEEYANHELFLYGRSATKLQNRYQHLMENDNIHFFETDYSLSSLQETFQNFDALIHLASIRYTPGESYFNDFSDDILFSENLFRTCEDFNVKNIIFTSSRSIYSEQVNQIPFLESDYVAPLLFYGISKLTIEKIANLYDLNIKCLRLAQVIGVGEREQFMLGVFIKQALNQAPITIFGEGVGRREYIYIKDVVHAIDCAMQQSELSGVFNIGSGVSVSSYELAKIISEILADGISNINFDPEKTEDHCHYLMDNSKAKAILGWEPKYTLEESFQDMKHIYSYGKCEKNELFTV